MAKRKMCTECRKTKALSQFHKHATMKDGLRSKCSDCYREYIASWRKTNRGKASMKKARAKYLDKASA